MFIENSFYEILHLWTIYKFYFIFPDMSLSYLPSVKAAEDCLEYLLNTPATLDKTVFKLSGDFSLIKSWLQDIEAGQVRKTLLFFRDDCIHYRKLTCLILVILALHSLS